MKIFSLGPDEDRRTYWKLVSLKNFSPVYEKIPDYIPPPAHLITNLAYRLKLHHTRNLYLIARLDTCADINIMPVSVYRLMFKDPELKKLAPSGLEIGTYTTDIMKIVSLCRFYLVHPDSKKLL